MRKKIYAQQMFNRYYVVQLLRILYILQYYGIIVHCFFCTVHIMVLVYATSATYHIIVVRQR
jgi:hypothetical protein